jgi:hypothetical protein
MNIISLIALQVEKEGQNFHFFIPQGTSYELAKTVIDEMKVQICSIEEAAIKREQEKQEQQEGGR